MASFRIFLAEGEEQVREVVSALIATRPEWMVCGETTDGLEVVGKVVESQPDLVLLSARLANLGGLEATRQLIQRVPSQKVILLSNTISTRAVREIYQAGAWGFVPKVDVATDLLPAIDALRQGSTAYSPRLAGQLLKRYLKGDAEGSGFAAFSEWERERVHGLAKEVSSAMVNRRHERDAPPLRKYVLVALLLLAAAAAGVVALTRNADEASAQVDRWLVGLGLKDAAAPAYGGNPDARVWIDVHTALYYCPGTPFYGRTPHGRFAKQSDAERDHFEPAGRKSCN